MSQDVRGVKIQRRTRLPNSYLHLIHHHPPQDLRRNSVPERTLVFWATTVSFPSEPERRDGKHSKFTSVTYHHVCDIKMQLLIPEVTYCEAGFKIIFTSFLPLKKI